MTSYRVLVDGKPRENRSEPFSQSSLRSYIIDNNLRLRGIDFALADVVYVFETVRRTVPPKGLENGGLPFIKIV
jgi:hypothetical protein